MNDREPLPTQRPGLVVRVAVTGHRPRNPDKPEEAGIDPTREPGIRESIRVILNEVFTIVTRLPAPENQAYNSGPPALRILSSLAEGADRMVVEEAFALRDDCHIVALECPLPAACKEYREDFKTPDSRDKFCELLAEATAVFELDGRREGEWLRSSDYGRAGHIAWRNCDLLIAIWDGQPGKGGGTGQVVRDATREEVPTVWIDVNDPQSITICTRHDEWEPDWREALGRSLVHDFKPPGMAVEWLARYDGETIGEGLDDTLRSDLLATHYGKRYRHSYRVKYALSALAVLFAVVGLIWKGQHEWIWPVLELAAILGILACFILASRRKWHERWLDYRLLAEQFRALEFLHPLGETVPVFLPPRYWGVLPERHSCVRWYFRARLRECRLANARVTNDYVAQRRQDVLTVARGQLGYHHKKHRSAETGHQFTEKAGFSLFALTAIACAAHLFGRNKELLGAVTATLPAFGAAMEGFQAQEEGKRIAGYAEAMAKQMEEVEARIAKLPGNANLGAIAKIAFELATEMTRETSGWHNLIQVQTPRV